MSAGQAVRQSALEAYAAYVEQCYQGEVNGEALFCVMAAASKDVHAQRHNTKPKRVNASVNLSGLYARQIRI
jgi:hypothetical protein